MAIARTNLLINRCSCISLAWCLRKNIASKTFLTDISAGQALRASDQEARGAQDRGGEGEDTGAQEGVPRPGRGSGGTKRFVDTTGRDRSQSQSHHNRRGIIQQLPEVFLSPRCVLPNSQLVPIEL